MNNINQTNKKRSYKSKVHLSFTSKYLYYSIFFYRFGTEHIQMKYLNVMFFMYNIYQDSLTVRLCTYHQL